MGFIKNIPELILIGSAVLVLVAIYFGGQMYLEARQLRKRFATLRDVWAAIEPPVREDRGFGLDGRKFAEIQAKGKQLEGTVRSWWLAVDEAFDRYTSPEEREGWFLTKPVRELLPESLIGRNFHIAFYSAFPGILTGSGLMLTFMAILLALIGVHYNDKNPADPVSGIGGLINGLSGKFLSSIVALVLSVLFTFFEKGTVRRLRRSYEELVDAGQTLFPYLSPSHILLDLQRFASKQTVSVSHISTEVVDRFVAAFQTQVSPALAEGVSAGMAGKLQDEFRPTMQRMNDTLEQLNTAIIRLESQKQESIAGELRDLLGSLERSLVGALESMGSQFHHALAGAATQEFGNIQGALEATRQMLSEMNTQFASMQAAFAGIIEKAEASTSTQLQTGKDQTEALTRLMEGLMLKLQETADNNVTSIRSQLTLVVSDLAQRVGSLSQEFMTAAQNATRDSQASALQVVEQTGNWSEATAKRLEALVNAIELRSGEFQAAGTTLLQLQGSLKETIHENAAILARIGEASRQVQAYSTALAGQAGALGDLNKHQVQISAQLKQSTGYIDSAFQRHDEFLKQYRQVFERYEGVFKGLDTTIGSVLTAIQSGMQKYTQSVEHNFQEIVKTANQMLPDIVKKLDAQTGEIAEQIEELSDVLGKGLERLNGRAK
jgi:Mg2+ and Co2+ transporter CorA